MRNTIIYYTLPDMKDIYKKESQMEIDRNQSPNTLNGLQHLYIDSSGNHTHSGNHITGDITVSGSSSIGSYTGSIGSGIHRFVNTGNAGNGMNFGVDNTVKEKVVTLDELKLSLNSLKSSINLIEMQIFQLENKGKIHKKRKLKIK